MSTIIIRGLKVYAYHGVNPEEKEDGQIFVLDIDAKVDLGAACITDRIEDTVSYAKIIKTAIAVMTAQKDNLIERAAQRVAEALLNEYSALEGVCITLKKPDAPIHADFEYAAVKIEVKRSPGKQ
ncbi:MAG: dihydroneopterin aldolase [Clostridiales bacterium]|nr:dihydroneopterin aldolase [Clostridiales bacterium]